VIAAVQSDNIRIVVLIFNIDTTHTGQ
jgi:hypothetical protein